MANRKASQSDDDEFHSLSHRGSTGSDAHVDDEDDTAAMAPPHHPIPSFQGAFEESIVESTDPELASTSPNHHDPETRRRMLLEAHHYADIRKTRWVQKPDAQHHPLSKLMAQIVFGMHLLQQEQAKSNDEVVRILQNHVNEVDSFLERTSEDFDLAVQDVEERIRHLRLPMEHLDVFETMLAESKFRTGLLKGNERISKIIRRTSQAMEDAVMDINCGIESTKELAVYLTDVEKDWPKTTFDIADVFAAMRGNEQGWLRYMNVLLVKSKSLRTDLSTLKDIIVEINRLAGKAQKRATRQKSHFETSRSSGPSSPGLRSKFAQDPETITQRKPVPRLDKPLPEEPSPDNQPADDVAAAATISRPHPVPFETRYEQPRRTAPVPGLRSVSDPTTGSPPPRSRSKIVDPTAGPRPARTSSRDNGRDLADFLRASGPLSSNPPTIEDMNALPVKKTARSQSQSAGEMMKSIPPTSSSQVKRSKSQGSVKQQIRTIPRKPVGSPPAATSPSINPDIQFKLVPQAGAQPTPDPASSNGFSRRLSKRLRTIPTPLKTTPLKTTPTPDPTTRAIDLAYSSNLDKDRKRSTSSPTDFTTDTENEKKDEIRERPSSRLGLFPKDTGPLTPSQATARSKENTPSSKTWHTSSPDVSPLPKHAAKGSRTLSIRRFFSNHKRNESQYVL